MHLVGFNIRRPNTPWHPSIYYYIFTGWEKEKSVIKYVQCIVKYFHDSH